MDDTIAPHYRLESVDDDNPVAATASVRELLDIVAGDEVPPKQFRTREYPSEILWHTNRSTYSTSGDGTHNAHELAELAGHLLSVHDSTAPVYDLLPLAAWAVLHGAPPELVTFAEDAS